MRVSATRTLLSESLWREKSADGSDWYVFFFDADRSRRAWGHVCCRQGFGHCLAIRYSPKFGHWIITDWNAYHLDIKILDREETELVFAQLIFGATCLRFKPRRPAGGSVKSVLLYCVPALKHLLGVKTWAVTPYQLYCYLIENGGIEVEPVVPIDVEEI